LETFEYHSAATVPPEAPAERRGAVNSNARKDAAMDAGHTGGNRLRFDFGEPFAPPEPKFDPVAFDSGFERTVDEHLGSAIERTREHLLGLQNSEGYWVGELEGDTILESEYILLLAYLGR
jgi:hypothetical protein